MPTAIKNLAKTILKEPEFVTITKSNVKIKYYSNFYVVDERERDDALIRLFDYKKSKKIYYFCRTKKMLIDYLHFYYQRFYGKIITW